MNTTTEKTHQEIVDKAIDIFENISKGEMMIAKNEFQKLSSIETLKVIAVASPHYTEEIVKLLASAKYIW